MSQKPVKKTGAPGTAGAPNTGTNNAMATTLGQQQPPSSAQPRPMQTGALVEANPVPSGGGKGPFGEGGAVEELEVFGDVPMARFGHTITLVSKTKVVLFGGATGDTGKYSMTGETYLFNIMTRTWSKLNGKWNSYLNCSLLIIIRLRFKD